MRPNPANAEAPHETAPAAVRASEFCPRAAIDRWQDLKVGTGPTPVILITVALEMSWPRTVPAPTRTAAFLAYDFCLGSNSVIERCWTSVGPVFCCHDFAIPRSNSLENHFVAALCYPGRKEKRLAFLQAVELFGCGDPQTNPSAQGQDCASAAPGGPRSRTRRSTWVGAFLWRLLSPCNPAAELRIKSPHSANWRHSAATQKLLD